MVNAHKVEQGPRVCPRLMVVLTQTLFVWEDAFFLLDHKGKYFSMARGRQESISVRGMFSYKYSTRETANLVFVSSDKDMLVGND